MSRHRDIRSMNISDEYDGYDDHDDHYGRSVEDDYCISPGTQEFIFDRSKQQNISSFFEEEKSFSEKLPELSDLDQAKLVSCIDAVRIIVSKETISDHDLSMKIIDFDFNTEEVIDKILNESSGKNAASSSTQPKLSLEIGEKWTSKSLQLPKMSAAVPVPGRSSPRVDSPRTPQCQSPISNQTTPDLRKKEDKKLVSSKSNTPRCQSPNPDSEARIAKSIEEALATYKAKRSGKKEQLHLVVVGHVDAGKSTLLGRLLCDLGQVSSKTIHKYQQESKKVGKQSFMYAWVLDETGEERERGITMDVGYSKFETKTKNVTLLDAPGHKDFIPNMIMGATKADVALLVIDATRGEFETGFESGGQTREHALLLRSLGVSQLAVVVNKLDNVDWSKDRFNEIVDKISVFLKQIGFRDSVTFVPCSGISGENVIAKPKAAGLSSWYNGPTLLEIIDSFKSPERPVDKPFRFSVNDVFKGTGSGFCVSGRVETGMVSSGDKILIFPRNNPALIRGILIDESPVQNAFAGDNVTLTLINVEQQDVAVGDIICNPYSPVPTTTRFEAHVVVFNTKTSITRGMPVVLHQQSLEEPATIHKIIAQLHKSTGEVVKKKPRFLPPNSSAIVDIETQKPVCMQLYRDVKQLGRVMLRVGGTTVAAGLVTKIK